jgi:hypothetical protein|tara:strand:+ start:6193 stop:6339 length:147 start_codon:yes stop_codon:yes gene_type:complete
MAKGQTHYLPNGKVHAGKTHKEAGVLMSGEKHTQASKVLTHAPPKKKK